MQATSTGYSFHSVENETYELLLCFELMARLVQESKDTNNSQCMHVSKRVLSLHLPVCAEDVCISRLAAE